MRGTPTRLPNWPQASRPIDLPPSRKSLVSWSLSKDSATAQRAPPGPDARHELAPMLFGPLPGFEVGFGGRGDAHGASPSMMRDYEKWSER